MTSNYHHDVELHKIKDPIIDTHQIDDSDNDVQTNELKVDSRLMDHSLIVVNMFDDYSRRIDCHTGVQMLTH